MTLEVSVELERIAAQVREDALLLDLVQSTPNEVFPPLSIRPR